MVGGCCCGFVVVFVVVGGVWCWLVVGVSGVGVGLCVGGFCFGWVFVVGYCLFIVGWWLGRFLFGVCIGCVVVVCVWCGGGVFCYGVGFVWGVMV